VRDASRGGDLGFDTTHSIRSADTDETSL
jgi:hypothetical protein